MMPWWILILISFVVGFIIYGNGFNVFVSGFLSGTALWLTYAWFLDFMTESILSAKLVLLFPVDESFMLIVVSGIIGGLAAGLGATTGNSLRLLFVKKKKKGFYN